MKRKQLSLFDWRPDLKREPEAGEYVETHGAVIPHIMMPGHIGRKVVYDCSTASHRWLRVGVLEDYTRTPWGSWRAIINVGKKDRILRDHRPGLELFELEPRADIEARG